MPCTGHDVILIVTAKLNSFLIPAGTYKYHHNFFVNVILLFCSVQILWHVSDVFWTHIEIEIILVSPMLHEKGIC